MATLSIKDLGLLCSGLGAATCSTICFVKRGTSVADVHRRLVVSAPVSQEPTRSELAGADKMVIHVVTLTAHKFPIVVSREGKIADVKAQILSLEGILPEEQRLVFEGKQLEDDRTLADYNVREESTMHLILRLRGGGGGFTLHLDPESLDPVFSFDFTNVRDDNRVFYRGGEIYRRPCGWKRYALAVLGKYGGDEWLGPSGSRQESDPNEWPVSYHGTSKCSAKSISEDGFKLSKGRNFKFGRGVYTTPNIEVAATYATEFCHEGRTYMLVLQNRVNPKGLLKFDGGIWLSPREEDVRPYGILIKKA